MHQGGTAEPVVGRLTGQVVLVTGAARGQGAAEARWLQAEGAHVVLCDHVDPGPVCEELGDRAESHLLDVTDPGGWAEVIDAVHQRHQRLDGLVNNAGIVTSLPIEETSIDEYQQIMQVNAFGCWLGMRSVLPLMRASGGGSIVNVSSTAGFVGGVNLSAYSASKFAIRGMTRSVAAEVGRYGVRVNAVHPGAIATDMLRGGPSADLSDHLPLRRVGDADEIAALVAFLVSAHASYCTGAEFVADGGYLAAPPNRIKSMTAIVSDLAE